VVTDSESAVITSKAPAVRRAQATQALQGANEVSD